MKKLFFALCILAAISLFAACNADEDNASNQQGVADHPAGEHITFTWWQVGTPTPALEFYTSYSDNPISRYLEHRFNVTFEYEQAVSGTEGDSLALMMGTGRYTHAINLGPFTGNVAQLFDDGIIIDIAEWLDYMPNFRKLLEENPRLSSAAYNDDGRILMLPTLDMGGGGTPWAGLMYRHDILEAMTDGNVQFPSGNDAPTTIADWEYMLPIFLEYFQAAGYVDYAPMILPARPIGLYHWGELMSSFGGYYTFYVRDDEVRAGILEPAMFEYVKTMRDWFEKGWIHQDFASRTQDMFFNPNPPLVFGGMAGAFYGMLVHLDDRMSVPELGMNFDVRPIASPLADGITQEDMLRRRRGVLDPPRGTAVYVGNPDIGRFLTIMDHLYSDEGGLLRTFGLTAEQIPPNDRIMARLGMSEGVYWYNEDGLIEFHPYLDEDTGHINGTVIDGLRLPGIVISLPDEAFADTGSNEINSHAEYVWGAHDAVTRVLPMPEELTPTTEESAILTANNVRFMDYIDQMIGRFITGATPLTEETWNEFTDQMRAFGVEESRDIWQTAYDRWRNRGQ
jgi:hypothetical protein